MYPQEQQGNDQFGVIITPKAVIQFVKRNILIVGFVSIALAFAGYAYSFTQKEMFEAQIVVLPEMGQSDRRALNSLTAGIMGLSVGDNTEAIRPDVYPSILTSTPCIEYLLSRPVLNSKGEKVNSLKEFYLTTQTGVDSLSKAHPLVTAKIEDDQIKILSKQESDLIRIVQSSIGTAIENKIGAFTISFVSEDPVVSSYVVKEAITYLDKFVNEYKLGKTSTNVELLEKSVADAKAKLESTRAKLQSHRDTHLNVFLNTGRITEQVLQEDYSRAQSVYSDLARQLEMSKIKLNDTKPIFKVLEEISVPQFKASPSRKMYFIVGGIIGFILSLFYVVIIREKLHKYVF